jgi:hypothetical protein
MTKLTIEIDMDDTQESWDALFRRIEEFDEDAEKLARKTKKGATPAARHVTYDLLLDPERAVAEIGDFFAVLTGRE